jgi:cyanophycinase
VGLDENTAIVVERENTVQVLGEGGVYIVDGRQVTCTNMDDENHDRTLSIFNVRLHVLSQGDEFDLFTREPIGGRAEKVERELISR